MRPESAGGIQVTGQDVVKRGDVGGALDGGMATQRQHAAPGPADITEQQLQ